LSFGVAQIGLIVFELLQTPELSVAQSKTPVIVRGVMPTLLSLLFTNEIVT